MAGSRLRLKSGEENSGRSDVGSMRDARPALASGASVGSSRGAEGAESIGLPSYYTARAEPTENSAMTRLRQNDCNNHRTGGVFTDHSYGIPIDKPPGQRGSNAELHVSIAAQRLVLLHNSRLLSRRGKLAEA